MVYQGLLVKKISQREGDNARGHWVIASYLMEEEGTYPKRMAVDVSNSEFEDRIGKFDSLIGKKVKIRFDIDAHEYQGKWFNSIRAFGINEDLTEEQKEENRKERASRRQAQPTGTIETAEGQVNVMNGTGESDNAVGQQGASAPEGTKAAEGEDDLPF